MKIGVLTSGGDAPGMNAGIRAATRYGIHEGFQVYGIRRGYEGLIDGEISEFNTSSVAEILHKGGTMLETARSERFMTPEGRNKAAMILQSFGIEALVVIGGDGSMAGALALSKEHGIPVMCLPGTIDNDLGYTDYTIGFNTAVGTVVECVSKIRDTSSSHERTTIIEVMGRRCGDIALYSGLSCGAESILVPSEELDINAICKKILTGKIRGKKHNIIMKAEGVQMDSYEIAKKINEITGVDAKVVVLSYLQRGGSPSAPDRMLASRTAAKAIDLIKAGSTSKAIGIRGGEIISVDLEDALKMEKGLNKEFLDLAEILS